jgi:hypothetical protein
MFVQAELTAVIAENKLAERKSRGSKLPLAEIPDAGILENSTGKVRNVRPRRE